MGRQIITETDVKDAITARDSRGYLASGNGTQISPADEYSDRLIKLIPSEVISVYLFVSGILSSNNQIPQATFKWLQWGIFIFLLLMTPVYLWQAQRVNRMQQLLISTLSFIVWVFTLGGPFTQFGWYLPVYGAILLPLYTFSVARIKPGQ